MTEVEWLACTNPNLMIDYLWTRTSERKLRLFACGCFRQVLDLVTDEAVREAVVTAEQYADGLAAARELELAHDKAHSELGRAGEEIQSARLWLLRAASCVTHSGSSIELYLSGAITTFTGNTDYVSLRLTKEVKAVLLRDIVGDPFRSQPELEAVGVLCIREDCRRPDAFCRHTETGDFYCVACARRINAENPGRVKVPPRLDPTWLGWNSGTISRLALAMYDLREFDRLPILADALEEAGCTDDAILSHLRGPGPHVRGCWALDLILGRE